MNKIEFLFELEQRLQALPDADRKQSLEYYFEIIDDRMDEGLTEEEAVAACGSADAIAEQILMDTPVKKLVKQKTKNRRMQPWEIVLIVLGFPIWFSLAIAVFCVLLAVSAVLWVVVACVFVCSIACGACAFALSVAAIVAFATGNFLPGLVLLGISMICAGLTILFFLLGKLCGTGVAKLHKLTFRGIKRRFIRKEAKV